MRAGYAAYALDLVGHGDSPKPESRRYQMRWLLDSLAEWVDSLGLTAPAVIIGHSLGGYLGLEYAHRFPQRLRGLLLVDPFYSVAQLPIGLQLLYLHPVFSGLIAGRMPQWIFRTVVDLTSLAMGHSAGALHALPADIRAQTALDYTRTAPGAYNLPSDSEDLTPCLASVGVNSLVVWGEHDQTLAPASFPKLVAALPRARGVSIRAGHVPLLTHADWFNALALDFLQNL